MSMASVNNWSWNRPGILKRDKMSGERKHLILMNHVLNCIVLYYWLLSENFLLFLLLCLHAFARFFLRFRISFVFLQPQRESFAFDMRLLALSPKPHFRPTLKDSASWNGSSLCSLYGNKVSASRQHHHHDLLRWCWKRENLLKF